MSWRKKISKLFTCFTGSHAPEEGANPVKKRWNQSQEDVVLMIYLLRLRQLQSRARELRSALLEISNPTDELAKLDNEKALFGSHQQVTPCMCENESSPSSSFILDGWSSEFEFSDDCEASYWHHDFGWSSERNCDIKGSGSNTTIFQEDPITLHLEVN